MLGLMLLLAVFLAGWWCGHRDVEVETVTRIDTVYYERPREFRATDHEVTVRVPRMMFAANDDTSTSCDDSSTHNDDTSPSESVTSCHGLPDFVKTDSITIKVAERVIEYQDSTFYARVVGPVVGPMAPRLDYFESYRSNTVQTVTKRPRFALSVGPNISITPNGMDAGFGIQAGFVIWSK